jgi:nitrite reductase (NADH) large subunit
LATPGHEGHTKAGLDARTTPRSAAATACNKGTICKAIKEKGLFTIDEVKKHTKASAAAARAPAWSNRS